MMLQGEMDRLLRAVRDWPMATPRQLAKRLNANADRVSTCLYQAATEGWVHCHLINDRICNAGNQAGEETRYTLSDAGLAALAVSRGAPVRAFAAHYGISHTRHFRALMQAETTWWLYEVLGKMRDQGHQLHTWAHAPIRIPGPGKTYQEGGQQYIRRTSRHWPLALGVATLPSTSAKKEMFRGIIVEWDIGEVLPNAYQRRFALIYRWYERLLGIGDIDEIFPVLIMLTTTCHRASQLLLIWESCAYDVGTRTLPLFVAPWRETLSAPSAWCRAEAPLDPCRLLTGVYGVSDPLAVMAIFGFLPIPAPAENAVGGTAHRLVDRIVSTPRKAGLARAQLAISAQGQHILERIAAWPLLSQQEIVTITGMKAIQVQSELTGLLNLGLIASFLAPDNRNLYHLTSLGISYLAASRGATASWYAAGRQWPVRRIADSHEVELRLESLIVPYEHTRLTRWLFMAFLKTAQYFRQERLQNHHLAVWEESEARRHFSYRGKQRVLAPDAAGVYLIGDQVYEFLVESDRGTRHRKSLLQKFATFRDYCDSMAYHWEHLRFPLILILTSKGSDRVQELATAIVESGAVGAQDRESVCKSSDMSTNEPQMIFLIASQADIEAHGQHRPIWLDPTKEQRCYCFAGFTDVPDLARMKLYL